MERSDNRINKRLWDSKLSVWVVSIRCLIYQCYLTFFTMYGVPTRTTKKISLDLDDLAVFTVNITVLYTRWSILIFPSSLSSPIQCSSPILLVRAFFLPAFLNRLIWIWMRSKCHYGTLWRTVIENTIPISKEERKLFSSIDCHSLPWELQLKRLVFMSPYLSLISLLLYRRNSHFPTVNGSK